VSSDYGYDDAFLEMATAQPQRVTQVARKLLNGLMAREREQPPTGICIRARSMTSFFNAFYKVHMTADY